ncbi:SDR family NAD(P)-dependent oxidoreductase [Micromonospora sp. NPDC006766]|uniref:SDR family NAD(P)-dependent oxidoreductase n=1 Tax=Micromonospora sp. NPDC006766 TaxID=3154778 RepID=UPI0033DB9981
MPSPRKYSDELRERSTRLAIGTAVQVVTGSVVAHGGAWVGVTAAIWTLRWLTAAYHNVRQGVPGDRRDQRDWSGDGGAAGRVGATVVVVGRDAERGRAAVKEIRQRAPGAEVDLLTADMSSLAEVRRLAAEVLEKYHRLDVLDNNAGVIMLKRQFTVDGYETMFAVNHLAPFLLTSLLRERLVSSAPARVITVSSDVHRSAKRIPWDELARGEPSYPLSKLANILFTVENGAADAGMFVGARRGRG